jgi:hypothetical protein
LSFPGCARGLKAAGEIDRLTPKIVGESLASNDPCHQRAGANANPDADGGVVLLVESPNFFLHVEREFSAGFGMIWPGKRNAASDHVTVADGFDFFQAALFCQKIEGGKDLV